MQGVKRQAGGVQIVSSSHGSAPSSYATVVATRPDFVTADEAGDGHPCSTHKVVASPLMLPLRCTRYVCTYIHIRSQRILRTSYSWFATSYAVSRLDEARGPPFRLKLVNIGPSLQLTPNACRSTAFKEHGYQPGKNRGGVQAAVFFEHGQTHQCISSIARRAQVQA